MSPSASLIDRIESIPRRELYFFALYRVLIASVIAALLYSPLSAMVGEAHHPRLAYSVGAAYLLLSLLWLVIGRNERWLRQIVVGGVLLDIIAASLLAHALPGASAGISMSLLFNIAAAATMLPFPMALGLAVGASVATVAEYLWKLLEGGAPTRTLAELAMFTTSYLALAFISSQVAHRARRSQQLANQRGDEVANLFQINELIIRRMRTGVLVVDADNHIKLANEAASLLLGDGADGQGADGKGASLLHAAPELARRLQRWRNGWQTDETPMQFTPDQPDQRVDVVDAVVHRRLARDVPRLVQRRAHQRPLGHALGLIGFVARQHDVQPAGQGLQRQAFPRRSPHQARLADGDGLELLQIAAQPPGQSAVAAYHAVAGASDDEGEAGNAHFGSSQCSHLRCIADSRSMPARSQ